MGIICRSNLMMTTLTLLAMAVCLCALPALGDYYNRPGAYPGSVPYYGRSAYRYGSLYPFPKYGYGPRNTYTYGADGQGADNQGDDVSKAQKSNGGNGQGSHVGNGQGADGVNGQGQHGGGAQGPPLGRPSGHGYSKPNPRDAVAFSGNRKSIQHFYQPGPVIFDDVTTNIGGAYNSDYGVFTAFESGIYLINYNVVSPREGEKSTAVDLLRNREVINSASGSGSSGEASNSAVLYLNRYDQLSVQGRAESAVFCGEGGDDAFCSFSVALLKLGFFIDSEKARKIPGW